MTSKVFEDSGQLNLILSFFVLQSAGYFDFGLESKETEYIEKNNLPTYDQGFLDF